MPQISDDKVKVFDKSKEEMSLSPYCKNISDFSLFSLGAMAIRNTLHFPRSAESPKWSCHPRGGETHQQTRLARHRHSARTWVRWREGWQACRESGAVGGRKQLAVQEGVVMGTNRRRRRREYKKSSFLHRYSASYSAKITLGFQRNIQINFDPLRYLF